MSKLVFWFCILSICLIIQGNSSAQAESYSKGYITAQNGILFTHDTSGNKSRISTYKKELRIYNWDRGAILFFAGLTPGSVLYDVSMVISDEGNVGIGTSSPEQLLHVAGANPRILVEGNSRNPEVNFKNAGDASNDIWALYKDSNSDDLRFYQDGDKLTIQNATGNVGIGTTAPGKKLYVNGSAGGTQAWNASDKREKTQVKPIENALESLSEIRGISYRWKKGDENESKGFDNKTHFGVIAQELEEVYPELVDNPGNTQKRKHVEYNGLIGVLIEAVKELKMMNDDQKAKIAAQQAQLEKLSAMIKNLNI